MSLRAIVETDTRWHLVAENSDGQHEDRLYDVASIEVLHMREAVAERDRIEVVVTLADDDALVSFKVVPS